jgi:AraC family transcriptional regulator
MSKLQGMRVLLDGVTDAQGPERTKLIQAFGPQGSEALGLYHFRCEGAPALAGLSDRHTIVLNRSSFVGIACTIGRQGLDHTAMAGNVTLIPADTEWTATAGGTLDNIIVSIPKASFAVAAAQAGRPSLSIAPQMRGRDGLLRAIIDEMVGGSFAAAESDARWHELTSELLDHLAESYGLGSGERNRGRLAPDEIGRINAYLAPRLEQTVAVEELAEVVARSSSHFPRVFRSTVGLSPHQYVVRLRLRRARELIAAGLPLAEAAVGSGFVDQSHLSYWVRRVHGTTPARWGASRA